MLYALKKKNQKKKTAVILQFYERFIRRRFKKTEICDFVRLKRHSNKENNNAEATNLKG